MPPGCSPYGQPGDRLYVRETFARYDNSTAKTDRDAIWYRADLEGRNFRSWDHKLLRRVPKMLGGELPEDLPWHPSIHMPRWASRIDLEVTGIRVERVQDATEGDCIAEGMEGVGCEHGLAELTGAGYNCTDCYNSGWVEPPGLHFMELWDSLNAKRGYSWESNPFVWVVEFRRVEP